MRARRLVEAARVEVFQLCTSQALLAELLHVLSRPMFAQRLRDAGLIVSGDSDLLELRAYQGIPILKPADRDGLHLQTLVHRRLIRKGTATGL